MLSPVEGDPKMDKHGHKGKTNLRNSYVRFLIMAVLSVLFMYILMYAMVDVPGNIYLNFNQLYMAVFMAVPMVALEFSLMGMMYRNKRLNLLFAGLGVVLFSVCFIFIRRQTAISDRQFLRSMIPHHGGAILMCEQAAIGDPEIRDLCRRIRESQQAEIDWMKAKLRKLGGEGHD
jgi:hypothetical protein